MFVPKNDGNHAPGLLSKVDCSDDLGLSLNNVRGQRYRIAKPCNDI